MKAAIPFPPVSPEIFTLHLGSVTFSLRWYALAYLVGIFLGFLLARAAIRREGLWPGNQPAMSREQLDAFLTWLILGVIIGGRLGFVLFYEPAYYLQNPLQILEIWNGGMSFHGGFLGVVVAAIIFCRKHALIYLSVGDMLALATPPGLLLGRIANFVNGELWGRPTDASWGVIFPGAAAQSCATATEACARHPSQLYEAGLEGLILGLLLIFIAFNTRVLKHPGRLMGTFIMGYGIARFIVEFFRLADAQFISAGNPNGHVIRLGDTLGLTMGQTLSLPMVLVGLFFVLWSFRKTTAAAT